MAMTREERAEFILSRLEGYWAEREDARKVASQAHYGHPGAFIPMEAATRDGARGAVAQALADIDALA